MPNSPAPKLFNSLRQLAATALEMLHTRLALAGIEFEEEIQRLLSSLALLLGAFVFAALGLCLITLIIVLLFDPTQRVAVLSVICLLYLGVSMFLAYRLKRMLATRPAIFATTLAELEKDRHALRGKTDANLSVANATCANPQHD